MKKKSMNLPKRSKGANSMAFVFFLTFLNKQIQYAVFKPWKKSRWIYQSAAKVQIQWLLLSLPLYKINRRNIEWFNSERKVGEFTKAQRRSKFNGFCFLYHLIKIMRCKIPCLKSERKVDEFTETKWRWKFNGFCFLLISLNWYDNKIKFYFMWNKSRRFYQSGA